MNSREGSDAGYRNSLIAFTGGGTAGHIFPGIAVIAELKRRGYAGRIIWLGSTKLTDRQAVESAGVEYFALPSGKLRRSLSIKNLFDIFKVLAGYLAARRILTRERPQLLFSKGGYVSVPPCRAARALGIPLMTHESDLTPGLATRLNARIADTIAISYEETRNLLAQDLRGKALLSGNPVRREFCETGREAGRAFLGVPEGVPVVLFVGGSQGARQINSIVAELLPELCTTAFVVHQHGNRSAQIERLSPGQIAKRDSGMQNTGGSAHTDVSVYNKEDIRYYSFGFASAEMPLILAAADIVAGRAGAGTLWECGAAGKPMILIPLCGSGTRGDQVDNALLFEKAGAARCFVGKDAEPAGILKAILHWTEDPEARNKAGEAARTLAGMDAAGILAQHILSRLSETAIAGKA